MSIKYICQKLHKKDFTKNYNITPSNSIFDDFLTSIFENKMLNLATFKFFSFSKYFWHKKLYLYFTPEQLTFKQNIEV